MRRERFSVSFAALLVLVLVAGTGAVARAGNGINSSIHVGDGEVREGKLSALNGGISVGDGARVRECESVNGPVRVGRNATVERISAVNGQIDVGDGTVVEKEIESVNGPVSLSPRAVAEAVSTVNGPIRLSGAEVGTDLRTVNGDITLEDGSVVGGDVVIEESHGSGHRDRKLHIELSGGSEIRGNVINEDPEVEVRIRLLDGSRIGGRVENAEIVD